MPGIRFPALFLYAMNGDKRKGLIFPASLLPSGRTGYRSIPFPQTYFNFPVQ